MLVDLSFNGDLDLFLVNVRLWIDKGVVAGD